MTFSQNQYRAKSEIFVFYLTPDKLIRGYINLMMSVFFDNEGVL
ncbi:hypothetical protein DAQ1742_03405 [Dickeya aquatica]|uniref:Uncharacterized protein n=1 Tax=Dickeya aquatica TaxID=1401087 RepID=A0A375ADN7_9GAMM|nr:hypothetical protein DAQ1742_03405 [Dickeya aquatica]